MCPDYGRDMITVEVQGRRVECGTASEIAERLTSPERPITADHVRGWARRGHLTRYRRPGRARGTTWYPLLDAARAELATRPRATPRTLDAA